MSLKAVQSKQIAETSPQFELESYISNYYGRHAIDRLLFIADRCPPLTASALGLAIARLKQTQDVTRYQTAVDRLHSIDPSNPLATLDMDWVDNTSRENRDQNEKLEQELKRYKNNLLKESIRMGYADLGDFYFTIGDLSAATQSYMRQREYCTTHKHMKDLSLDLIRVYLYQQNWSQFEAPITRLEQLPNGLNELEPYAKAARGLWMLSRGQFKTAAALLLEVKADTFAPPKTAVAAAPAAVPGLPGASSVTAATTTTTTTTTTTASSSGGAATALSSSTRGSALPSISEFVTVSDISVIVGLCTLATYSRNALKDLLDNNANFKELLESEAHVRTLLESFVAFDYKATLDTLEKHKSDYLLDIWLADYVAPLFSQIRENCYTQYVKGYKRGYISRMAARFGATEADIEKDLVALIQSNKMTVRLDLENKIFVDMDSNERAEVYQQIMTVAQEYEHNAKLLLVNVEVLQGGLEINPPRPDAGAAGVEGKEKGGRVVNLPTGRGQSRQGGGKKKGVGK
ncbi:26S proteasome subunit RPN7-domain-containing protein [Myxozyma melibiosi]|uniref:26S proteasome subunit RPN7-domain-containing protein n=1 Tax=Myxozyma melibiosi TaxID=54550 RepID=A0ABR1FD97_9ASCO